MSLPVVDVNTDGIHSLAHAASLALPSSLYANGDRVITSYGKGTILGFLEGNNTVGPRFKVQFSYGIGHVQPEEIVFRVAPASVPVSPTMAQVTVPVSPTILKFANGDHVVTSFGEGTILSFLEGNSSVGPQYCVQLPYGIGYVQPDAMAKVILPVSPTRRAEVTVPVSPTKSKLCCKCSIRSTCSNNRCRCRKNGKHCINCLCLEQCHNVQVPATAADVSTATENTKTDGLLGKQDDKVTPGRISDAGPLATSKSNKPDDLSNKALVRASEYSATILKDILAETPGSSVLPPNGASDSLVHNPPDADDDETEDESDSNLMKQIDVHKEDLINPSLLGKPITVTSKGSEAKDLAAWVMDTPGNERVKTTVPSFVTKSSSIPPEQVQERNNRDHPPWMASNAGLGSPIHAPPNPVDEDASLLTRTMFDVHTNFQSKFPTSNPFPNPLIEFLARPIISDDNEYDIGPNPGGSSGMIKSNYFNGLPLAFFDDLMTSRDLNSKLGLKRFPKTKFGQANVSMFEVKFAPTSNYRFWVFHHSGRRCRDFNRRAVSQNKKGLSLFHKFQSRVVEFFQRQFDSMLLEEKDSISNGLIGDGEMLYVIGLDNAFQYHIVAAVQYVTTASGAYINWLAVEHQISANAAFDIKGTMTTKLTMFRNVGLGQFLLVLIQSQQMARNWKITLILQANPKSAACTYYKKRGFQHVTTNLIDGILSVPIGSFDEKSIYFISEERQIKDGAEPDERLILLYQEQFMFSFPDDNPSGIIPSDGILFEFPFNSEGIFMDAYTKKVDVFMFSNPYFGSNSTYALRNATDSRSQNSLFRAEGMYEAVFDTVIIDMKSHRRLNEPLTGRVTNVHVNFWSCWMLRCPDSSIRDDVLIVPLDVSECIVESFSLAGKGFCQLDNVDVAAEVLSRLVIIDKYLWGHKDLFKKRLLFFTTKPSASAWTGFAMVNPWVRLVKFARENNKMYPSKDFAKDLKVDDYLSGILFNHCAKEEAPLQESKFVLWFLNLASRYRDLRLQSKHLVFNYKGMVQNGTPLFHLLLLGLEGPFGNIPAMEKGAMPVYPFLSQEPSLEFVDQGDNRGAEAWCLFMYDTILSLNGKQLTKTSWMRQVHLGLHGHSKEFREMHPKSDKVTLSEIGLLTCFYVLFQAEMTLMIERLRYYYLCSLKHDHRNINIPDRWGDNTELSMGVKSYNVFKKGVLPILQSSLKDKHKPHPDYKLEHVRRSQINNPSKYGALSDFDVILESPLHSKHCVEEGWFTDETDPEYIQTAMEKDSLSPRRWMTFLYTGNHVPVAPSRLRKSPPADALKVPPIAPVLPPPPPVAPPIQSPPPENKRKRKTKEPPPPKAPATRERQRTDAYVPPANSIYQRKSKPTTKPKRLRKERLDERWGYLPENMARGLETNVMGLIENGGYVEEDALDMRHVKRKYIQSLTALADEKMYPLPPKLPGFQTEYKDAEVEVEELLNLPDGEEDEETIRKSILDQEEVTFFDKWIQQTKGIVELESNIMLIDSVTSLAWIPESNTRRRGAKGERLKGKYVIRVQANKGDDEEEQEEEEEVNLNEITVQNDWVEANFSEEVLATVQDVAYQKLEVLDTGSAAPCSGFLKIEGQGDLFVDVEEYGISVWIDNDIINRLKYEKTRKTFYGPIYKRDKKGLVMTDKKGKNIRLKRKVKTHKARWLGYSNKSKRVIPLDMAWVEANFDKRYLSQLKNVSNKQAAFVPVPPGDNRNHSREQYKHLATGPRIKYVQVKNEQTCMVYAMASAVHYAGRRQLALEIQNMAKRFEFRAGAFNGFLQWMERKDKGLNAKREIADTFNILEHKKCGPILACIRGSDGKEDHCVAVYDRWIFDTNFEQALTLSRESLDLCCSSDGKLTPFICCSKVVWFPQFYMCQ